MHCSCEFESSNITDYAFSCRGSQGQFRNTVVFRAIISLQVPASVTDANDIVKILSDWVESMPSLTVNGIALALDSGCPAMLDSFDSNDCVTEAPPTDQTSQPSSSSSSSSSSLSSSTGITAGAGAAAAVVILLLIIVILIIIILYRRRKSRYRYKAFFSIAKVLSIVYIN